MNESSRIAITLSDSLPLPLPPSVTSFLFYDLLIYLFAREARDCKNRAREARHELF
jgi:hypothetical protein